MTYNAHLLAGCQELMSPQGCFYLVVVTENKPEEIMALLARSGFSSKVPHSLLLFAAETLSPKHAIITFTTSQLALQQYVLSRVAFNEHLSILRFWRD